METTRFGYLITGGAGFIGSHLTEALLARGEYVTVLDDLSTGRLSNLDAVLGNDSLELVVGSTLDPVLVDALVAQAEVVVHLADAVGVKLIVEHPLRSFLSSIHGTENVLAAAHGSGRKVVLASSSEIYGKNEVDGLHEESDRVLGPTSVSRWAYSAAKAADEVLATGYQRERGLDVVVVRFFNTVGPRQVGDHGMVLPTFVRQALAGEPLTVHGDGRQRRCFCHVLDVVDALVGLLGEPEAVGGVYNIGGSTEVSIGELAHCVVETANSSSRCEFVPYAHVYGSSFEDMRRRVPDTTRIRDLTGWAPTRGLSETILDVIDHERLVDPAMAWARGTGGVREPAPSDLH